MIAAAVLWAAALTTGHANNLPDQLRGHGGPIQAIAMSRDGSRTLTGSFDYSVILWDLSLDPARIVHRLNGHDSAVNDVEFVPGSDLAVSVGDDGALAIWTLGTGDLVSFIVSSNHKVLDVDVSPDGHLAAAARWDGTVRLYDLRERVEVAVLEGHRGNVNAVAFAPDGERLYSGAHDGQILEWDPGKRSLIRLIHRHGWGINSLDMIDGDQIVFGALDGTVAVVSVHMSEKIADLARSERPVQAVKVSSDRTAVAYGDGGGTIEVFDAETFDKRRSATVTRGPIWDFEFLGASDQIFHVGLDDFAVRWQVAPRAPIDIKSEFPRRFQVEEADHPGEVEFLRKCSICHTLTPDGEYRAGPTLYGVFGRRAGTLEGYPYSDALLASDVIWTEETIARLFEDGPDVMMPGTKMPIQWLKNVTRLDDLIDYLKEATRISDGEH